jgi:hypothetical protein
MMFGNTTKQNSRLSDNIRTNGGRRLNGEEESVSKVLDSINALIGVPKVNEPKSGILHHRNTFAINTLMFISLRGTNGGDRWPIIATGTEGTREQQSCGGAEMAPMSCSLPEGPICRNKDNGLRRERTKQM